MSNNPLLRADHNYNLSTEFTLSKEQQEGVEFLLSHFNSVVGFKPGVGKTLTMLTTLQHIFNYSQKTIAVIICPKSATTAFIKEVDNRIHSPLTVMTTELERRDKGSRMFLLNYSNLKLLPRLMESAKSKGNKVIGVFDEVHTVGNPDTKLYKTLTEYRKDFCCVYGMTATLFLNDIESLFWVLNFIRPGYFPNIWAFRNKYMIFKTKTLYQKGRKREIKECVGFKNLDELHDLVEKICIIRGKTYNFDIAFHPVTLTKVEQDDYIKGAEGIWNTVEEDDIKSFSGRLHDLQRIVDNTNSKMDELIKVTKSIVERGENVIIFTDYEESYQNIKEKLISNKAFIGFNKIFMITGATPDKERRKAETDMSSRDIVIGTRACSQSINLQAANNIIFVDLPFSIGVVIQSMGRILRMDTKYPMQHIHFIEAVDTIDTYKRAMFEAHRDLFNSVFGSDPNLPSLVADMSSEDILKMKQKFKRKFLWKR